MNRSTGNPLEAQQPNTERRRLTTSTASARRAPTNGTHALTGTFGLLRRMYPNLSHEQAAAMVRQRIMLEQLRKAATSARSRR